LRISFHGITWQEFTTLRYRIGVEKFDAMTCEIIKRAEANKSHNPTKDKKRDDEPQEQNTNEDSSGNDQTKTHKKQGKLILDASVADQMIIYPTDLGLVNTSRKESERIIDLLCEAGQIEKKPRTYLRKARKQYLNIAKKKTRTKKNYARLLDNNFVICDEIL